ncbi:MAG: ribosomal protein S18-alanine N-acetyltransferase [Terracidiphilus sp.]
MNSGAEAVAIRRMTAADLAQTQAIAARLAEAPHWQPSAYLSAIDPDAAPRRIALVAADRQSGSILAVAVASILLPEAELETIAVAPECQRRGIGRQILTALMDELKAAGVHELLLEVRSSNLAAIALYHALGFVPCGLRPSYYLDPVEDAVLMRLPLTEKSA